MLNIRDCNMLRAACHWYRQGECEYEVEVHVAAPVFFIYYKAQCESLSSLSRLHNYSVDSVGVRTVLGNRLAEISERPALTCWRGEALAAVGGEDGGGTNESSI